MKITIESTSEIVQVNGVDCRVWEGLSERGVRVHCLITRIAARADQDLSQFEAELVEHRAPSADSLRAFPLPAPELQFPDGRFLFFRCWVRPRSYFVFRVRADRDPEARAREKGMCGLVEPADLADVRAWLADHPERVPAAV